MMASENSLPQPLLYANSINLAPEPLLHSNSIGVAIAKLRRWRLYATLTSCAAACVFFILSYISVVLHNTYIQEIITEMPTNHTMEEETPFYFIPPNCLKIMAAVMGFGIIVCCAAPCVLPFAGFTTVGVTAGTAAAAWQTTMGGTVAAGSIFSTLQSAAAGGAAGFFALFSTGVAITGATTASALAFCKAVDMASYV